MIPDKLFEKCEPIDKTKVQGFGYGSLAMYCCQLGNITPGDIILIGKKYPANSEKALAGQPYKVLTPNLLQRYDHFEIPGATGLCFIKSKYVPAKEVLEQVPWEKLSPGELAKIYFLPGITSSKSQ